MRLGIDGCCWSNQRGFGRYTRELVRAMVDICADSGAHDICLVVDRQTADKHDFFSEVEVSVAPTRLQPTVAASADSHRSLADMWRLHRAAAAAKLDLLFYPAVYTYFPPPIGVPNVVTLHDAIAEELPDLVFPFRATRWAWETKLRLSMWWADHILTVSEAARGQLERAFKLDAHRVSVSGEGVAPMFAAVESSAELERVRRAYEIPPDVPIILYVGGLSPHKNIDGLLRALKRLDETSATEWVCVLVGETEVESFYTCYSELVDLTRTLGVEKRIIFTGFVPDADLVGLYSLATLLVLPSFSEGFGLPVAEAMACGLPVVVSDNDALRETAGEAGIRFDPRDDSSLAAVLERALGSPEMLSRHRALGLGVAQRLSWRAAAERALKALEGVAGRESR